MTSENLFERFIKQELGDKVDDFSGESPLIEQYPVKIEVTVDYIFEPQRKRLISLMYEPRYSKRLDNIRSQGREEGSLNFKIGMSLEDFVKEFSNQLDNIGMRHRIAQLDIKPEGKAYLLYCHMVPDKANLVVRSLMTKYTQQT